MSKFKKSSAALESLQTDAQMLEATVNKPDLTEDELALADSSADDLKSRYEQVSVAVGELVVVAAETDPDRIVFGEGMVWKINQLASQLAIVKEMIDNVANLVKQRYQPILERKRLEAEMANQSLFQEKQRAEIERQKAIREEKERLKKLELKAKQAKELNDKKEAARREIERKQFEIDREVRWAAKEKTLEREKFLANRLEASKTMPLNEVLDIIESNNSPVAYKTSIRALLDIVDNIVSAPENQQFRNLRKANEKLQSDLLSAEGGLEGLVCLGFREKELTTPTQETYFLMVEPPVHEFDQWSNWFERLQKNQALLQTTFEGLS